MQTRAFFTLKKYEKSGFSIFFLLTKKPRGTFMRLLNTLDFDVLKTRTKWRQPN